MCTSHVLYIIGHVDRGKIDDGGGFRLREGEVFFAKGGPYVVCVVGVRAEASVAKRGGECVDCRRW